MKKVLIAFLMIVVVTACSTVSAKSNQDSATYLESIDENGIFDYVKLVDKETGCKYLIVEYSGGGRASIVQMLDKDGKPLCR